MLPILAHAALPAACGLKADFTSMPDSDLAAALRQTRCQRTCGGGMAIGSNSRMKGHPQHDIPVCVAMGPAASGVTAVVASGMADQHFSTRFGVGRMVGRR